MIYQNVRHEILFISFHCSMFVWVHLDALIIIAKVLYDVDCCLLTELDVLLFLLHLMCASYGHELYRCFDLAMPSLQRFMPCIFVIYVLTSTSMQTRLRDVSVFRDKILLSPLPAVILMPCIHVSTVRSMLLLSMFSKDVLDIWLCSIHQCPCLQL